MFHVQNVILFDNSHHCFCQIVFLWRQTAQRLTLVQFAVSRSSRFLIRR